MDILKLAAENSPSKMIYHEDTQALHIGTLDKHCYFVPFAKGQDPFEDRKNSQRMELLNGNWGFRYYDSIRTILPTIAGLAKFCPRPPKSCFTITIATNVPIAACQ